MADLVDDVVDISVGVLLAGLVFMGIAAVILNDVIADVGTNDTGGWILGPDMLEMPVTYTPVIAGVAILLGFIYKVRR